MKLPQNNMIMNKEDQPPNTEKPSKYFISNQKITNTLPAPRPKEIIVKILIGFCT